MTGENISQRQIVAIVIRGGLDFLSFAQKRDSRGNLARANIRLSEIMVGVEIARLKLNRLPELRFRQVVLA